MSATQDPDPWDTAPPQVDGPSGPRAGFWQRFAASFLDGILISVISVPIQLIDPVLYLAVAVLGTAAYYTLLEGGAKGQTVGKMALGIRVVDLAGGGPIGYGRGFIRWLGRYVSGIVIALGYLWMRGTRRSRPGTTRWPARSWCRPAAECLTTSRASALRPRLCRGRQRDAKRACTAAGPAAGSCRSKPLSERAGPAGVVALRDRRALLYPPGGEDEGHASCG